MREVVLICCVLILACVCTSLAAHAQEPKAKLDWMIKAYGDGRHNAFTDLARWKDHYYLCFRHGEHHVSMDGEIRVIRSTDLKTWEPCGTLRTYGDDRDPHFCVTDDELFVYFGVWDLAHWDGPRTPDRKSVRSHFASTKDGTTWSKVRGIWEPGWWLWRVKHHDGMFYSCGYTAVRPAPEMRETVLFQSPDGSNWERVSLITNELLAGEADMWFNPDGSMWLVTRTGIPGNEAWRFESGPDHEVWTGHGVGTLIHSPVFAKWKDRFFVSGRGKDEAYVTKIWELKDGRAEELITLPSGGDTAYPGLLVDPTSLDAETPSLFVSWYSQHDKESEPNHTKNTASVYVGRVTVTD
ncbi:MAG: hypothetical protein GY851_22775 [bacterium]|nr:hypothetical protein [bacterium]